MFKPLLDILLILCNLAEHAKEEVAIEEFIEKKQHQIELNAKDIEQKEALLTTVDLHVFINEDIQHFKDV